MHTSPALLLHICGGTVGLFSGAAASIFRKGSRNHIVSGNVFVVAMLTLAITGIYMAVLKRQPGNILGGSITAYLIFTAWLTARRREMQTSPVDWAAMLVAFAVAAVEWTCAIKAFLSPTGMIFDYAPGPYIMMGTVALLATVGDVRMLVRGGVSGTQRLVRHLWRMCFGLFIASGSIFLARAHLFPMFLRRTGMLYLLTLAPLVLMIFWMVRVRTARVYKRQFAPGRVYSARA